ncbi:uncharacterized protein BDV14DRAFT_166639, partial [Aspergillus stella-maris]|uniref:uncharacterized protein n=1 Tax=Aspergillus stella-maris TaxID=1810926 RepID=UPI003CCCFC1A
MAQDTFRLIHDMVERVSNGCALFLTPQSRDFPLTWAPCSSISDACKWTFFLVGAYCVQYLLCLHTRCFTGPLR